LSLLMKAPAPYAVVSIPTILGEGPIWSVEDQVLLWLDIYRPSINLYDPVTGTNVVRGIAETIYAAGFVRGGGYVASLDNGFALLASDGTILRHLTNPNAGRPVNFNDGRVDRRGRFWSGTMAKDWKSPIGSLWRLGADAVATEMDTGIVLANGIGFSPDDRVFYFTDFAKRIVFSYPFDIANGSLGKREVFVSLPESDGSPDGLTVDVEGHVWIAHWDGWCVTRHDPKGREVARISFLVQRPTSVAFGGSDLSTLYVTSATMGLNEEELARAPLSGSLFAVETPFRGQPEAYFIADGDSWVKL
jgi:sugar lactone lactonase YvrE